VERLNRKKDAVSASWQPSTLDRVVGQAICREIALRVGIDKQDPNSTTRERICDVIEVRRLPYAALIIEDSQNHLPRPCVFVD
jgi:hypothetical protein